MADKGETLEQLDARREKIMQKVGPIRAEMDKLVAEYDPKLHKLRQKLREVEEPLYDIDMKRAPYLRRGNRQ